MFHTMHMPTAPTVLTTRQVAERIGVHASSVRRWADAGLIADVRQVREAGRWLLLGPRPTDAS